MKQKKKNSLALMIHARTFLRRAQKTLAIVLSIWAFSDASSLLGQERIRRLDTFTVILENDVIAGTDADYTAGTELAWSFAARTDFDELSKLPRWYVNLAKFTLLGERSYDLVGSNIAIGQKIFTPQDLREESLITDDRPYAGWSYLNLALHGRRGETLDSLSLSIGMVGPDSFAEDVQTGIHQFLDEVEPQGWDNQLKNELGLALSYDQNARKWVGPSEGVYSSELIETRSLSIGNIETSATLGYRIRFGRNLPSDFKTGRIRHSVMGFEPPTSTEENYEQGSSCRLYCEAELAGSFVAQNIFLDGNTFADSHSVDKRNWVAETSVGITYEKSKVRLSLFYTYKSQQFETQEGGSAFGSLAISFR